MKEDNRLIPSSAINLMIGYFKHTLTEKEHDALDDWINASDENLMIFEEMVGIVFHPKSESNSFLGR